MKIMFSCIHFPKQPYPPQNNEILKYFIPVNCMGWQVCILNLLKGQFYVVALSVKSLI